MKKGLIVSAVVVVLVAIVAGSILKGDRRKRTEVYLETVAARDVARVVTASGQITPRVKVSLSAHVVGKIERLYVDEGQDVLADEPFLELEKETFVAARDTARAQVAIEEARLRQAEIDLADAELKRRRAVRLAGEGIASDEAVEAAEIQFQSAELARTRAVQGIRQARANLEKAEDDLAKTTIFAPLTGRVIELNAEEGEVVVSGTMNNPGSVIAVVADLSELLAEVDVDETEIVDVALEQIASVEVDALPDAPYEGRVVEIGSSGYERPQQPDVTFFKVDILLDEPDQRLRAGMSARADIGITTREGVLAVPIQAVVSRRPVEAEEAGTDGAAATAGSAEAEEIDVVFVVDEEGAVRQTPVTTGIADPTHVEITAGLEAGDEIVTGPYRAMKDLADGDLVKERKSDGDEEEDDD